MAEGITLADLITMIDMVENHTDAIDLADRLWPMIRTGDPAQSAVNWPWTGNLSVDLRGDPVHVRADGVPLIDAVGVCWAVVFPDKKGFYGHSADIVAALAAQPPAAPVEMERRCQKCGETTKGEEALVDGQIWCHPCADHPRLSAGNGGEK